MTGHNAYMVIIKSDGKDFANTMTEEEKTIFIDHFTYLNQLLERGILVLAGPTLDDSGGYIFLKTKSLEEAKLIMREDPSVKSGIVKPTFHEFRISLCQCHK